MTYTDPDSGEQFDGEAVLFTGPAAPYSLLGDGPRPSCLVSLVDFAPVHEGRPHVPQPRKLHVVRARPDAVAWPRRALGAGRPALGPYVGCASCATGLVRPSAAAQGTKNCARCRTVRSREARIGE